LHANLAGVFAEYLGREDAFNRAWRKLSQETLQKYGRVCMKCGATYTAPKGMGRGRQIVVDHIFPLSRFPELALDENNLQVLCNQCNTIKGNRYAVDFRPGSKREVTWFCA
jgi:5-methylcytosine-specific restriction endonuclease McrA